MVNPYEKKANTQPTTYKKKANTQPTILSKRTQCLAARWRIYIQHM